MNDFTEMTFAGFRLPRISNGPTIYNPTTVALASRLKAWRANGKTRGCIGRVTYPNRLRTARTAHTFKGWGCYIDTNGRLDDRTFSLRWHWADEVPQGTGLDSWREYGCDCDCRIGHSGWFIDDMQDEKIRGIVVKLPRGRGYLAGWSMGEGMASELDVAVYEFCSDAIAAADSLAEKVAEREREYRDNCCDECGEHADECQCGEEAVA